MPERILLAKKPSQKEETVRLEIPVLMPEVEGEHDLCINLLGRKLQSSRGILRSHLECDQTPPRLCVHYDPNELSLESVLRIAEEAGASLTHQYRHERIPFSGLDNADSAMALANILEELPGILHARVNYAAGLAFVAYDSAVLDRERIESMIRRFGASPIAQAEISVEGERVHPGVPAFFPRWMKERWSLSLVVVAGISLLGGWVSSLMGLPPFFSLLFYLLAYITGGYEIITHAVPSLLRGHFDTDVLMMAAALGAAALGEFGEGAFLLFLFSAAHVGEHYALDRARQAVNAMGHLMPRTALVRRGNHLIPQRVEALVPGDVIVVRPGDRISVDGVVVVGESSVDQSAITGESLPVQKEPGDQVFAGTINQDASLDVRATRYARDNTLNRVLQMVAEAQSQQSPIQRVTERFMTRFVPVVLVLVVLIALVPPALGWMDFRDSFYRAMLLLVASSPCALALGAPATVLAGIAQAARNGVLIKGGAHLENLGAVRAMAFDKTGTLTEGLPQVSDVIALNGVGKERLLQIAYAVEQHSNHPLAKAVVQAGQVGGLEPLPAANVVNLAGKGVRAEIAGEHVLVGSLRLFTNLPGTPPVDEVKPLVADLEAQGKTAVAVQHGKTFVGVLGFADRIRPDAPDVLSQLRELGVEELIMLTGDNLMVARQIALEAGLTDVRTELLPENKQEAVGELMGKYGQVAMAGDGVNDAPALAQATVGIAMGGAGAAVALETADVVLMADDLNKLPFAVGLSRASRRIIQQNLVLSLGVIGLLVGSAILGLLPMSGTVILHEGSTLLVVLNALRLLGYRGG